MNAEVLGARHDDASSSTRATSTRECQSVCSEPAYSTYSGARVSGARVHTTATIEPPNRRLVLMSPRWVGETPLGVLLEE